MLIKYNINSIISVEKRSKTLSEQFEYIESTKILNLTIEKGGFYNKFDRRFENPNNYNHLIIEDKKVFLKPNITFNLLKGYEIKYFETEDEMENFYNKISSQLNLIEL